MGSVEALYDASGDALPDRPRWMLDANAFDYLLDRNIEPRAVRARADVYITNVQHAELLAVPLPSRRKRLIGILTAIDPTVRPARADAWPDGFPAELQGGYAPGPDSFPAGPSSRALRDGKDRAIAAAAAREGCIVVTDDLAFRRALLASGAQALACSDAFAQLPTAERAAPRSPAKYPAKHPAKYPAKKRRRSRPRAR